MGLGGGGAYVDESGSLGDGRPPKPAFMKDGDWQCPNDK